MFYSPKKLSYYTPTSPQRPLFSVPKVAVVEKFDCIIIIIIIIITIIIVIIVN